VEATVLRMSTLFLRTLREDPADAEVPSHRLLVRAGYVRRVSPGIFTWLPLGYRVLRNVERIIRESMDEAGFQEVHFPALLPREHYEATGRWDEYGPLLFKLQDRKGIDYLLGPTHEEMFTLLVKSEYSSYKDLPVSLYQIGPKYRDEARPRAGILRGREFIMKDSYSFDVDDEGLERSYQEHRAAYIKTFDRLGLSYEIVSAMSGAMGGSASEEFLAPSVNGEDTYVKCESCGLAANVEAVRTPVPDARPIPSDTPEPQVVHTPDAATIATLVDAVNNLGTGATYTASDTLKNVVVKVTDPHGDSRIVAIGLPGDRDVDMKRLAAQFEPSEVALLEAADFAANPFLVRGYIGPGALKANKVTYLLDPRVTDGTVWITGADQDEHHVIGLIAGRDFSGDGTIEAAEVREGDACPNCGQPLIMARGIEVGHIFQLGRKYAEALDLKVLDANGKQVVVTMGSYGIGVSRAVAAIAEQTLDDIGLCWPREVAPADVHIVATGKDEEVFAVAERISNELQGQGVEVLFDDRRGVSPGVKFKDAELIGVPTIVVVGKGLGDGVVEVRNRRSGDRQDVPVDDAVRSVVSAVRES
jgi:prolyl-tRNA synthetase